MSAKFVQIPTEVLTDVRITPLQLRLYCLLMKFGYEGRGHSQCGHALLARFCHAHPQSIAKALKVLPRLGYISVDRIGLNKNDRIVCLKTYKKDGGRSEPKSAVKNIRKGIDPSISKNRTTTNRRDLPISDVDKSLKINDHSPMTAPFQPPSSWCEVPQDQSSRPRDMQAIKEHQPLTDRLLADLAAKVRPQSFYWFGDMAVVSQTDEKLIISLGDPLGNWAVDWVRDNYANLLNNLAKAPVEVVA